MTTEERAALLRLLETLIEQEYRMGRKEEPHDGTDLAGGALSAPEPGR